MVTHNSFFADIADTVIRVKNGGIQSAVHNENPKDADEETSFGETVSFWQAAPKEEGITEQESLVNKPDGAAVSGAKPGAAFRKKAKTAKSADAFMAQMPSSAAFRPPLTPKLTTPQEPFGRYFCARS